MDNGRNAGERLELRLCDCCRSTLSVPIGEHAPSSRLMRAASRSAHPPILFGGATVGEIEIAAHMTRLREALGACRAALDETIEARVDIALRTAESAVERWRTGELSASALAVYLDEPARILFDVAYDAGL